MVAPTITQIAKNWLLQNETNLDFYDSAIGSLDLQTYVPVIRAQEILNLGSTGSIVGTYVNILGHIYTWGVATFGGTGIDVSTGFFRVTLPVAIHPIFSNIVDTTSGRGIIIGVGNLHDASATSNRQTLQLQARGLTTIGFLCEGNSSGGDAQYDNNTPITWADGDQIKWFARYPRA